MSERMFKRVMTILLLVFLLFSLPLLLALFYFHSFEPLSYEVSHEAQQGAATTSSLKAPTSTAAAPMTASSSAGSETYIEIVDSCGIHYEGTCVVARSGPGTQFPVSARLRDHMVLKVGDTIMNGTSTWYKVVFDEFVRYPERIHGSWYVSGAYVRVIKNEGDVQLEKGNAATSSKRIIVDRSEQKLYAYDGEALFMEVPISTGLLLTPTPRGTFTIFKKTPSRYMQGPLPGLPSDQYYDLPGVPWNLYFTQQGAVIHGAYWHNSFGHTYSHGCVNLSPEDAERLYYWADVGTPVVVRD